VIVLFFLYHLGVLIYSIILFNNAEYHAKYQHVEPQYFFLEAYVCCYGIVIFGAIALFILVVIIGAFYSTKLLFRKKSSEVE
jgi:hypothetical protein